jgi:hypothetical protein
MKISGSTVTSFEKVKAKDKTKSVKMKKRLKEISFRNPNI